MKQDKDRPEVAGVDRRRFLTAMAVGAGLGPLTLLTKDVWATRGEDAASASLCYVSPTQPGVLTKDDIKYLGSFKVPSGEGTSQALYYSNGSFSLRRGEDGRGPLTFLMVGPPQTLNGWERYAMLREFSYPGESLNAPPEASTVRDWSDILNGKAVIKTPNDGGPILYGLWYDQDSNLLWWTYQTGYNTDHNPSLGCTQMHADGSVTVHGPWRTNVHSGKTGGFITPIPPAFRPFVGGRTHVLGAPPHVQNGVTAFGGQLQAITLPDRNATPDTVNGGVTVMTLPLLDYDVRNPQPRDVSGLLLCDWNCKANPMPPGCSSVYDSSMGGTLISPQPYFSGSKPGNSYLLDWMDTCAWIDTGSKRGIVQFGQLADTIPGYQYTDGGGICHNWYGGTACVHGQVDVSHPATGPGAGTLASKVWIWDPNDLIAVAQGQATAYSALPTSTCLVNELAGASGLAAGMAGSGNKYRWGQSHYDPVTGKLFVSETKADKYGCCSPVPRIHVFQIT